MMFDEDGGIAVCDICGQYDDHKHKDEEFTFGDAMEMRFGIDELPVNKPKLKLTGMDGNAFFIIGRGMQTLRRAGYSKEDIDAFEKEATSGDYDNVLVTAMKWFDVS